MGTGAALLTKLIKKARVAQVVSVGANSMAANVATGAVASSVGASSTAGAVGAVGAATSSIAVPLLVGGAVFTVGYLYHFYKKLKKFHTGDEMVFSRVEAKWVQLMIEYLYLTKKHWL